MAALKRSGWVCKPHPAGK